MKLKEYTDNRFIWLPIGELLREESKRQVRKWGIQTHTLFEWLTYTTEELGSLAKAISELTYRGGKKEKVVSEAIQVATLALKIAEMVEFDKETK